MKKMKRIAAAGLVLSMMLTACGGSKTRYRIRVCRR